MRQAFLLALLVLSGCSDADERYDVGYDDGYAEGYNTTCQIRATMVEGDWEDENYSQGYMHGRNDGARDCLASRL